MVEVIYNRWRWWYMVDGGGCLYWAAGVIYGGVCGLHIVSWEHCLRRTHEPCGPTLDESTTVAIIAIPRATASGNHSQLHRHPTCNHKRKPQPTSSSPHAQPQAETTAYSRDARLVRPPKPMYAQRMPFIRRGWDEMITVSGGGCSWWVAGVACGGWRRLYIIGVDGGIWWVVGVACIGRRG